MHLVIGFPACTPPSPAPCSTKPTPAARRGDVERLRRAPSARIRRTSSRGASSAARPCSAPPPEPSLTGPAAFFGSMPFGADLAWQVVALNRLVLVAGGALRTVGRRGRDRMGGVAAAAGAGLSSEALRQGLVRAAAADRSPKLGRPHGRRSPGGRRARVLRGRGDRRLGARAVPFRPAPRAPPPGARVSRIRRRRHRRRRADRMLPRGRARGARALGHRPRARRAGRRSLRRGRRHAVASGRRAPSRRPSSISRSKAGTSTRTGRGARSRRPASTSGIAARGCSGSFRPGRPKPNAPRRLAAGARLASRRARLAKSCPERSPLASRREHRRVLFYPDEAVVDPRRATRAAWLLAERRGVAGRDRRPVRRFPIERGVCRGVETDAGSIASRAVVDAAGAWAAFDGNLPVPVPVVPVRGQIVEFASRGGPSRPCCRRKRSISFPGRTARS